MQKITNTINIRYNRFNGKSRFESEPIKSFNFEKGLVSKDIKDLWFINKAKSENEKVYDEIISMYFNYLDNDISFLDDFQTDEILFDYKAERLLEILKSVQNLKYKKEDLENIFKLKYNDNPELHFYVKRSKNNFTLILIDLYHMAIYGTRIINGKEKPISMERIYKKYKDNKCLLDKIKDLTTINN